MSRSDLRRRLRLKLTAAALPRLLRPTPRPDLVRIGSAYGGWWVPESLLDAHSVCYLAGVGEDISFDVGVLDRFSCEVVSLDPTPRAIAYIEANAPEGLRFLPVGLGGTDRVARFYAPRNPHHVSHSITNLQGTSDYFEAELRSLASLMNELGHQRLDLLKMDIEGAEYEVLDEIMGSSTPPRIVCVEFDQPASLKRIRSYVQRLRAAGYELAKVEGFNATFVGLRRDDSH